MSSDSFEVPSLEYLGERLPQYAFESFIAQGGMGAIYLARQISLDRNVAIKVLPQALGADADFRACLSKEAKAMARLNHPNLISVFDSGDVDGMPYIVMEYIEGCSLHESAWNQVIDPIQAATIIKEICDGLAHAHEHGIIHRDIKPANILLTTKAEPKIGDFGLAHPVDSDHSGLVMGTPGYTAPEIFVDPDLAGPLADIYSVGVILHQLITGIDPAGSQGPPTHPSGHARLDAIWRKATQANPAARYSSVAAMAADLQKCIDSRNNPQRNLPAAGGIASAPQSQRRIAVPAPLVREPGGSSLFFKVAAVGIILAVLWFAYGLIQRNKDADGPLANTDSAESPGALPGASTRPDPEDQPVPAIPDETGLASDLPKLPTPAVPAPFMQAPEPKDPDPVVSPAPHSGEDLAPGDPVLLERAIALIVEARKKRDASVLKNAKPLQSLLKERARNASQADADFLNQFAEVCNGGWLPDPATLPELNPGILSACQRAYREQLALEATHQSELTRIRDFYVPKLREAAEDASDPTLKRRLLAQAEGASDLAAWVGKLAPEPERPPVRIKLPNRGFVGHWDVTTNSPTQWIADANGVVTINDGQWKGKTAAWKMMPDGTVEVTWPDKPRPYVLSPNGNGWSGKTSFGTPVTVVPGRW